MDLQPPRAAADAQLARPLDRLLRFANPIIASQQENSQSLKCSLPWWPPQERAMPNYFARSSLFAPIARGRRVFHRETLLVCRGRIEMRYTGEQLDEADADLLLELIHHARTHA